MTARAERLLPEHWPLHQVARDLGKSTTVLIAASRRGQFPAIRKIGRAWMVKADAVREWLARDDARGAAASTQTALALADQAAGCPGRRGRRTARGSSDSFA